jgi:hypothetical protein
MRSSDRAPLRLQVREALQKEKEIMPYSLQAELAADVETNVGRPRTDDVDGISEDEGVEGGGDDGENEAPIDVGYDTDDDGDSGPDGYSTDEEE